MGKKLGLLWPCLFCLDSSCTWLFFQSELASIYWSQTNKVQTHILHVFRTPCHLLLTVVPDRGFGWQVRRYIKTDQTREHSGWFKSHCALKAPFRFVSLPVSPVEFGREQETRFYVLGIRRQDPTVFIYRVREAAVAAVYNCTARASSALTLSVLQGYALRCVVLVSPFCSLRSGYWDLSRQMCEQQEAGTGPLTCLV